jgi:hypothetical protein
LIIAIIEHSKIKSKQKIIRDPSIRKFGSARKIGYSEPERSRRLRKNRFRYEKHFRLQGSAMAAAALPAKEAKGKSMKASTPIELTEGYLAVPGGRLHFLDWGGCRPPGTFPPW